MVNLEGSSLHVQCNILNKRTTTRKGYHHLRQQQSAAKILATPTVITRVTK